MGDSQGRGRTLAVVGTVMLVTGVLTACGTSPGETEELQDHRFQEAKVEKLPGGDKIAVGSPDGHRVVVQWQSKGSDGWTKPETVYTEQRQFTHDVNVVAAGDTVALNPDFWTEKVLDDDHDPDHTVQVLCSDRDCGEGHRSDDLSGTALDRTGDLASFPLGDDRVLLWRSGSFDETEFTGLPKGQYPQLFPDGSFGVIAPEKHGDACRYRLLTTSRGETSFVSRAVSDDHAAAPPCGSSGFELGKGTATIYVEELEDSIEFRRTDGTWVADEPTSALAAYPDTRGESSLKNDLAGRSDDSTVAIGSPDMKRIYAQYRAARSREWTRPVQVATAPAGTLCRFQSVDRDELAVADMISCFDVDEPFDLAYPEPSKGIALATGDGRTWDVETLDRPRLEVGRGAGQDKIFRGSSSSLVWSPTAGMRRIDLPLDPERDGLVTTPDGKLIRLAGNPSGGKACRPAYQVAEMDATSWPEPRPLPGLARLSSDDAGCTGSAYFIDDGFEVEFLYVWLGRIVEKDGDWVAVKSDSSR